jgi:uncharacterized DUF497 family protein
MRFTWRESKRRLNWQRHRIDLPEAARCWQGFMTERYDGREDYGEDRWVAGGLLDGTVVVVVYTEPDDDTTHLISVRRATSDEQADYWQAYPR